MSCNCGNPRPGGCTACNPGYTLPPSPVFYPNPPRGCICPPTSEQTCQSPTCPRRNLPAASAADKPSTNWYRMRGTTAAGNAFDTSTQAASFDEAIWKLTGDRPGWRVEHIEREKGTGWVG